MKKGKLFLISFVLFTCLLQAALGADQKSDYLWRSELEGDFQANRLYKMHLTENVLEKAKEDLFDLRIYSDSKEVPYVIINETRPKGGIAKRSYSLKIIEFLEREESNIIIAKLSKGAEPVRGLSFNIHERDFKKEIVISVSSDKQMWEEIGKDFIYDFTSQVYLRKTEVDIPETDKKFFRIEVIDPSPGVNRNIEQKVELQYKDLHLNVSNLPKKNIRISGILAATKRESEADEKVWDEKSFTELKEMVNGDNRTLIGFACDSYVEKIKLDFKEGAAYREVFVFEGKDESECLMRLDGSILRARGNICKPIQGENKKSRDYFEVPSGKYRYVLLAIINKDNPPLDVSQITVSWTRKNIFFIAPVNDEKYHLYFGNVDANKPNYDIHHFVNTGNWYKKGYIDTAIGEVEENKAYEDRLTREEQEKLRKLLMTIITFVLVGALGFWLYFLARSMSKNVKRENE